MDGHRDSLCLGKDPKGFEQVHDVYHTTVLVSHVSHGMLALAMSEHPCAAVRSCDRAGSVTLGALSHPQIMCGFPDQEML